MNKSLKLLIGYLRATRAVSALEYAVLVGVVVVVAGGALATFGTDVENAIQGIGTNITGTTSDTGDSNP